MKDILDIPASDRFPGWPLVGGGSEDGGVDAGVSGGDAAGAGSDSGDAGGTPDVNDLVAVAEQFDAEALGQAAADSGTEDGEDGAEGGGKPTTPTALDTFIQRNYGGDQDAFVESLYTSRSEQKRLADEVRELRQNAAPQPKRDVEAEIKAARDSDAEVQAINQDIAQLQADNQSITKRFAAIVDEVSGLQEKIAKADGEFLHADDVEKPKLLHNLGLWKTRVTTLEGTFDTLDSRRITNDRTINLLKRDLGRIDREIRNEHSAREQDAQDSQKRIKQTSGAFASSYNEVAKEYGLETGTARFNFMKDSVRTQLAAYIDTLEEGIDAAGIHEAVGRIMGAAAAAGLLSKAPPKPSKGKPGTVLARQTPTPVTRKPLLMPPSRRPAGTGTPNPSARPASGQPASAPAPKSIDDILSDADQVRARARAVFAAQDRAQAARNRSPS